jgi:group I intron endonuclease
MDHHPTSFFILENTQLGTFWVGQAKMSHLPAVTRDGLIQKLETRYPEYGSPCLHLVSINKNGTFPFYGVERWLSKLEYRLKQSPHKHEELRNLLTAGWHSHDFTINSTLNVLHSIYKTDLKVLYKRLLDEWKSRGLRCLNTQTGKSYSERYEKCKKDPNFMYKRARKEVLRQMEKTKKLPKPETLAKYDIKEDELREIMGPKGIIYKITSPSGKVYVGQTVRSFEKRMQEHRDVKSKCSAVRNAIDKYGDEMKYEIIEDNVPQEQLDEREIYWISYFNSLRPNGYNLKTGGRFYKATQEMCDNMRDAKRKLKIEKDGYIGYARRWGNTFYPAVNIGNNKVGISNGGFRTEEEAIEVLKEYTKDPENFKIVDGPLKKPTGCITLENNRWRLSCKCKKLGSYITKEEAQEALERYLNDPENFIKPSRKVGSIHKVGNKRSLYCAHRYLGTYDTEQEAQEALERYLDDPENFPTFHKNIGSVRRKGNTWQLRYKEKHIGSYTTREEAEEARKALQSS